MTTDQSFASYCARSAELIQLSGRTLTGEQVTAAIGAICGALQVGKPVLVCGNGGSAADSMHLAAELMGRFKRNRKPLKVMSLATDPAFLTAWANDFEYETVFSRQVEAYGEAGAVLIAISTSGNSRNVIRAMERARSMQMVTVALTGEGGGAMAPLSDHLFAVPCTETALIQQVHLCLYHWICDAVEQECGG
jgi:D-sedoheptulose 7-phosphate isomerase